MTIQYKTCTSEDAQGILIFLQTIHEEKLLTLNRMPKLPTMEQEVKWLNKFDGESGFSVLAKSKDLVVGFLHAEVLQPRELSGNCGLGISILAPYRRQGLAMNLMQRLEKWAEGIDVFRLELEVFSNNKSAITLYRKMGFAEDGCRKNAVQLWNGDRVDLIHMCKFLRHDGTADPKKDQAEIE